MLHDDLASKWRSHQSLFTYDPDALSRRSLPAETQQFLTIVGMPLELATFFPLTHIYSHLPKFDDIAEQGCIISDKCHALCVFAALGDEARLYTYYCLEERSGAVYLVDLAHEPKEYQA